ncbi:MAG TPA: serine acetyltransferase [Polyangiaceae bacterium]|jgi:serine O-acetyltransferase|nr:serine acetyltransferase [Polyangiaceae bacterium]
MRVVGEIVRDTLSIARTLHGKELGPRQIAATIAHDGAQTLALWRLRKAAARQHIPLVGGVLRRMQTMLYGIHIESDVTLGEGVLFAHTVGVVIGGNTRVGDRVMFLGDNTIGSTTRTDFPSIESDVVIGAGARIIGDITVGTGAAIGANAVVTRNISPGSTAVGIPAVERPRRPRDPERSGG